MLEGSTRIFRAPRSLVGASLLFLVVALLAGTSRGQEAAPADSSHEAAVPPAASIPATKTTPSVDDSASEDDANDAADVSSTRSDAPASDSARAERPRLLVLSPIAEDAQQKLADVVGRSLTLMFSSSTALQVFSSEDLRQLVALESERQALGCDATACLAEIAGAMGARYIVYGSLVQLGSVSILQLSLFDAERGEPVGRQETRASDDEALLQALPQLATRLAAPIGVELDAPAVYPNDAGGGINGLLWSGVGGMGVGALVALVGVGAASALLSTGPLVEVNSDGGAKTLALVGVGLGALAALVGVVGAVIGGVVAYAAGGDHDEASE